MLHRTTFLAGLSLALLAGAAIPRHSAAAAASPTQVVSADRVKVVARHHG
ncbi:MAG TPA: hypothetical protein VMF03_10645 [Steroidobacteraceae bacterium]|nr:hypothetical protein [Steroidobacteraceae bacterium]